MANDYFKPLTFCHSEKQRQRFKEGILGIEWAARYPQLFDDDDRRLYQSQGRDGYHFYEWLGAILMFETTGYLSLVQKYLARSHPRKVKLWEVIAPPEVRELPNDYGWPDLFAYSPDHSDWFFCETKGKDPVGEAQVKFAKAVYELTGRAVYLLQFTPIR